MICRLCLKETQIESSLDIFGEEGAKLNIVNILDLHFWFTPLPQDAISTTICQKCWLKVIEFHQFYEIVELAHAKMRRPHVNKLLCEETLVPDASTNAPQQTKFMHIDELSIDESDGESISALDVSEDVKKKPKRPKVMPVTESDEALIKKHIPLGCNICMYVAKNFTDMRHHFKIHHEGTNVFVICCDRKLTNRPMVVEHAKRHENPELFKCQECQHVFSDDYHLRTHMLSRHSTSEDITFNCDQCPKKFARQRLLDVHKPTHIPKEERSFYCEKCPQSNAFSSEYMLKIHTSMCHNKAPNVCHVCGKTIRTVKSYNNHMRIHADHNEPRIQCPRPDCNCWLKDEDRLKQHLAFHNVANKTLKCNVCGNTYKNRRALVCHTKYAHCNTIVQCDECPKTFKTTRALQEHMTQHTGESLYSCQFCGRRFNFKSNMNLHRKKMHAVEWENFRKTKYPGSKKNTSNNEQ